jgi:hypothetical protein
MIFFLIKIPLRGRGISLRDFFGVEIRLEFRGNSPKFIPMRPEFDLRAMRE